MTALWTAAEAAAATGGRTSGNWTARGVSIDTRTICPGDLFVALKDIRDGHDFVAGALEKGAAAALVSRRPEGVAKDVPLLEVQDVLAGLEALGRAGRARCSGRVVAITGSAGKTSTKEMLRDVLSGQGRTLVAEASYNNHWGVPLTLARMPADTEYAVIEVGMNAPKEIAPLAKLARPHVALITTVAPAHLAAFESIGGIAAEKADIFQGLEAGGTAIFNGDIEQPALGIVEKAAQACGGPVRRFGTAEGCDYRLKDLKMTEWTSVVRAAGPGGQPLLFKIGAPGRHFAMNALAVLAVVDALGLDADVAASDFGRWAPPAGRGTRETIVLDIVEDDMTIDLIDDAFNANPASMAVALEVLAACRPVDGIGRVSRGRRIAVLGDMLELGERELDLHAQIARLPWIEGIEQIHCVGPRMEALWNALPGSKRGVHVGAAEDLTGRVHTLVDAGDVVLVKGSKGSRVSSVVDAIRKLGHRRSRQEEGAD
ncbi:MAG: UDP-N-acetylmuramoyl-tripeptide--D-alanyl-D-alanine ligase [Alphaproteobacteria bacterium]|nr:UDP-N-acetylmuramoyl-tripeptide--D-alanyl-D-alanine ligase [Alphaproteobacteria bacterium]NNF24839.1 UDP-N-acetylmuramoyl-tripeptide--D-alanyl-D-alanine ligase [Paracoccaceae bacterium]